MFSSHDQRTVVDVSIAGLLPEERDLPTESMQKNS